MTECTQEARADMAIYRSGRAATKVLQADDIDFSALIRPGDRIAWGQCGAEPLALTRALMAQRHHIGGRFSVFLGMMWSGTARPEHTDVIDFASYSGGGTNRALMQAGVLDVLCCHYSDFVLALGPGGANQVDVLMLQVAPPGPDGRYSLSAAHEYLVPMIDTARLVIAEVNHAAPWTYGPRSLAAADIDVLVHSDRPLLNAPTYEPTVADLAIGRNIASLIEDGATLQVGVGALPDAVLACLHDHRDIGIHSGALTDGVCRLAETGVVTNARKSLDRGVTIGGVLMGGERLNAHVHLNPLVQMRPTAYTHDTKVLAALDRFVAVNGAVEVDLTGQVNAESAGGRYVGAVGGALDFVRGARASRGGFSVFGLPSRAGTRSRIVAQVQGPVSTPRSDVGYVVTEYGIADLRGATAAQRIDRMLAISHPDDRAALAATFGASRPPL
jgi:acyl-CoA hydrolase